MSDLPNDIKQALDALSALALKLAGAQWKGDWASTVTYVSGDLVARGGKSWFSLTNGNRGNDPQSKPFSWHEISTTSITAAGGGGSVETTDGLAGAGTSANPVRIGPDATDFLALATPSSNGILESTDKALIDLYLVPSTNRVTIYASPLGDDTKDGLSWETAVQTGYVAYEKIIDAGGGELHFADNTDWGGPVTDQGMWLRGDGRVIAGWQAIVPLRLIGHGGRKTQFGQPAARLNGGIGIFNPACDRFHPLIWIVSNATYPIEIKNVVPGLPNVLLGRYGWDYRRDDSGNIQTANITNWNRASGSATVTVSLPAGISITSASRTANVTTINFSAPVTNPAFVGMYIKVTSTNVNFTSGDYVCTEVNAASIKYAETAANQASTPNIGSWATHGVMTYDRVEVTSSNSEVPSTAYRVSSVTDSTHFVVTDYYGYAPRSATVSVNNIGTYVLQDRANYIQGLLDIDNFGGSVSPSVSNDGFIPGPNQDFGGTSDGRINFRNSCNSGYLPTVTGITDPDRNCWLLADGGSHGAAGLDIVDCRNGQTGVRAYGAKLASWAVNCRRVNSDAQVGVTSPPAVEFLEVGDGGLHMDIDQCIVWDNPTPEPNVRVSGGGFDAIAITNSGIVEAEGVIVNTTQWAQRTDSAIQAKQYGLWLDRIHADSPQPRRAFSPVTCRYQNWVSMDPATWTLGAITATQGIADPRGLTGAVELTGGLAGIYILPQDINNNPHTSSAVTHVVGDRWVFGGAFRLSGGLGAGTALGQFSFAGLNGGFGVALTSRFAGDGEWQWVINGATIETVDNSSCGWRLTISARNNLQLYQLFATRIPSGDMSDNEFAEYVHSLQSTPYDQPPGAVGLEPEQILIAPGGYGIDSTITNVVGAGSGQLTLTGVGTIYEPVYDSDGTTILGWRALLQATVNP